jgi:hypothetical protein
LIWLDFICFENNRHEFIILVSNLKEISLSVFSWKKEYIKNYDAILLLKYDSGEKNILNYAYVLINGVSRYNIFLSFYSKLAESSFLCRFRVETANVLVCSMCFFSTNNFVHAQTLYRMRSLCRSYECMNIVRVNIGFFTGFKKIKQWRIFFVLGYLRMILWKISTAISMKHRILVTFNIKNKIKFRQPVCL